MNANKTTGIIRFLKSQYKINFVDLYISDSCSLKCIHCFHGNTRSLDKSLSTEEWLELIGILIKEGICHFHLSGRDPLSMPRTLDILNALNEYRKQYKISFGLITDGIETKVSIEEVLKYSPDYIEISFDIGLANEVSLRGSAYDHAILSSLEKLTKLNFSLDKISLALVITNKNHFLLIEQINTVRNLGFKRFYLQPVELVGYAKQNKSLLVDRNCLLTLINSLICYLNKVEDFLTIKLFIPLRFVKSFKAFLKLSHVPKSFFNKIVLLEINNSQIEFELEGIPIQLLNTATFTYDGYILKTFKDRENDKYRELAIGKHEEIFSGKSLTEICRNYLFSYFATIQ